MMRYSIAVRAAWLAALLGFAGGVRADVGSDRPAAILVFPKIVVDTSGVTHRGPTDTLVRVSNTSDQPVTLWCFYIDATPHCGNTPTQCVDGQSVCGSNVPCLQQWQEVDFVFQLTPLQPVAWLASRGAPLCDETDPTSGAPCLPLGQKRQGPNGEENAGFIVPVSEDPFVGELKCIEVDDPDNHVPVDHNDVKGEVEIVQSAPAHVDVSGYNAVGIEAIAGANNGDSTLIIGGPTAEYNSCPNILMLDHFFDGAKDPVSGDVVTTDLTLVPCSEDFAQQQQITVVVQFLVFNEFEQRFSTSHSITCFREFRLTDIDQPFVNSPPDRSIFSAGVMGTLTGQTRIRGVPSNLNNVHFGQGLLGVAEEFRSGGGTASFNLHFHGTRPQSDIITVPDGL